MKTVEIYTDGSCLGNPGPGGWGAVLVFNGNEKEISGGSEYTTNNQMELTAVIEALSLLKEPCNVTVTTDSQYVVNAIQQGWLKNWVKTDFRGKKNKELWLRLIPLLNAHNVQFIWIKGHAGHHYNERCDMMAVRQSSSFKWVKDNM